MAAIIRAQIGEYEANLQQLGDITTTGGGNQGKHTQERQLYPGNYNYLFISHEYMCVSEELVKLSCTLNHDFFPYIHIFIYIINEFY